MSSLVSLDGNSTAATIFVCGFGGEEDVTDEEREEEGCKGFNEDLSGGKEPSGESGEGLLEKRLLTPSGASGLSELGFGAAGVGIASTSSGSKSGSKPSSSSSDAKVTLVPCSVGPLSLAVFAAKSSEEAERESAGEPAGLDSADLALCAGDACLDLCSPLFLSSVLEKVHKNKIEYIVDLGGLLLLSLFTDDTFGFSDILCGLPFF